MPLTNEQWALIQPLLPPPSSSTRGRPPIDQRRILDAVLWKIRTSAPWYDLPPGSPAWQTCYRRFHIWNRDGVLSAVFNALDKDLRDRGGLNLRAALAGHLIDFEQLGELAYIRLDPTLQAVLKADWQYETIYLLVAVLFRLLRKKFPDQHVRLAVPDLIPVPPC
jgi:transposase